MATHKEVVKELKSSARALKRARAQEQQVWAEAVQLMKNAHEGVGTDGTKLTFQEIADIYGVTKARIYQCVSGIRGGTAKPAAAVAPESADEDELGNAEVGAPEFDGVAVSA